MPHTPGPWHTYAADYQRLHDGDLLPIFTVGPSEFHTVAQVRAGNTDDGLSSQTKSNAKLIAASLALLAACEKPQAHLIRDWSNQAVQYSGLWWLPLGKRRTANNDRRR